MLVKCKIFYLGEMDTDELCMDDNIVHEFFCTSGFWGTYHTPHTVPCGHCLCEVYQPLHPVCQWKDLDLAPEWVSWPPVTLDPSLLWWSHQVRLVDTLPPSRGFGQQTTVTYGATARAPGKLPESYIHGVHGRVAFLGHFCHPDLDVFKCIVSVLFLIIEVYSVLWPLCGFPSGGSLFGVWCCACRF